MKGASTPTAPPSSRAFLPQGSGRSPAYHTTPYVTGAGRAMSAVAVQMMEGVLAHRAHDPRTCTTAVPTRRAHVPPLTQHRLAAGGTRSTRSTHAEHTEHCPSQGEINRQNTDMHPHPSDAAAQTQFGKPRGTSHPQTLASAMQRCNIDGAT